MHMTSKRENNGKYMSQIKSGFDVVYCHKFICETK